jgi:uncharacterized protein (UPF0335 family)
MIRVDSRSNEGQQIRSYVERVEKLREERDGLAKDTADIFAEAKGNGFDAKIIRRVVAIRKQDAAKRSEEEELLDLYLSAVGFDSTPLGRGSV